MTAAPVTTPARLAHRGRCPAGRLPRGRRCHHRPGGLSARGLGRAQRAHLRQRTAAGRGETAAGASEVQAELARALMDGPGLVVFKGAFPDPAVVDRATAAFNAMIDEQRASGTAAGDHFAKPGANDRVWNALEKLAVREPAVFVDYYANDVIALVSEAWLGPGYQVTSQVNVVNPGGQAQSAHRDYHLGFQTNDVAEQYPAHVHRLSPVLTLQGAVAHTDMPVESGPTQYLPHSQKYEPGYLAWRRPEFREHFEATLRAAGAGQGRCRLLQPGAVPRSRHQPVGRHPSDGEPAAGVVGVRPRDGVGGPGEDVERHLSGAARRARRPAPTRTRCATRWRPAPRATRSRPTSTATSRSAAWPPRPRPSCSAGPWPRGGTPRGCARSSAAYADRRRTDE